MDDGAQVSSRGIHELILFCALAAMSVFISQLFIPVILPFDYWCIEKAAPGFDDNKGVSLVLVNNEKGEQAFKSVIGVLNYKSTRIEDSMQPLMKAPFSKPVEREQFGNDFSNRNFEYITKKYARIGIINKVKIKLRVIKRKLF